MNRKSNGHRFVKRKAIKCCHREKVDLFRNQNKAELVKITVKPTSRDIFLSTAVVVFTLNLFYRSDLVPTTANSLVPRQICQGVLMDITRQKDHSIRFKINSKGRGFLSHSGGRLEREGKPVFNACEFFIVFLL